MLMEITQNISAKELEAEMWLNRNKTVVLKGVRITNLKPIGSKYWFEYHCNESHQSSDAPAWYRSHQRVVVLGLAKCDGPAFTTFKERGEAGHQLLYRVRFPDGLEWDVFEDELLDNRKSFCRPNPPDPLTPASC